MAQLFYHDVLAALSSAGVRHVIVESIGVLIRMKSGTGRAQDASDVDALRRIQETLRGR